MIGRKCEIDISYEGVNISKDISADIKSFTYVDNLDKGDELNITLYDKDNKWLNEWFPLNGDKIEVTILFEKRQLYAGSFQVDGRGFSYPPQIVSIKATSFDLSSNFKNSKRSFVFEYTTLKKVAEFIALDSSMQLIFECTDIPLNRVEQSEESNAAFIKRIAEENGASVKIINSSLVLFSERDYENKKSITTIELNNKILSVDLDADDVDTYDSVYISYYDTRLEELLEEHYSCPRRDGYKNSTGRVLRLNQRFSLKGSKEEKKAKLLEKAKTTLRNKNKHSTKGSITLAGRIDLVAGIVIDLEKFGKLSGRYIIESTTHNVNESGYVTSINIRKTIEEY